MTILNQQNKEQTKLNGRVLFVSTSLLTGQKKINQPSIKVVCDGGVEGDAHQGLDPKRQVSLLAQESIHIANQRQNTSLQPGDYAENITTQGLILHTLALGSILRIGPAAVLEISQIGKTCHHGCAIKKEVGSCIMPKEGIFGRVLEPGEIKPGDIIEVELVN